MSDAVRRRLAGTVFTATVLAALSGCGKKTLFPVSGTVVWQDNGQPAGELASGMVILETPAGAPIAQGDIRPDGTFRLGSTAPGDGAVLGKHRVAVFESRQGDPPPPPKMDEAHSSFDTSGLEITVEPRDNEVTLKVRRAKNRSRR
jgi:hypothetical protein